MKLYKIIKIIVLLFVCTASAKKNLLTFYNSITSQSFLTPSSVDPPSIFTETPKGWFNIRSAEFADRALYPHVIDDTDKRLVVRKVGPFRRNESFCANDPSVPDQLSFWFILNQYQLYYTPTQNSINPLGNLAVNQITSVEMEIPNRCLSVKTDYREWRICTADENTFTKFFCRLRELKQEPHDLCRSIQLKQKEANVGQSNLPADLFLPRTHINKKIQPIIVHFEPSHQCNENWTYKSMGDDWQCSCKELNQSPIDLPGLDKKDHMPQVDIELRPEITIKDIAMFNDSTDVTGTLKEGQKNKLIFEKHMIKIYSNDFGEVTLSDGSRFIGGELNFHVPSQHTIEGQAKDMELELVFNGVSVGDINRKVVISVLFETSAGKQVDFIDKVMADLPDFSSKSNELSDNLPLISFFHKFASKTITNKGFSFDHYSYEGSMTYPPCETKAVRIIVAKPIKISRSAIGAFRNAIYNLPVAYDTIENDQEAKSAGLDEKAESYVRKVQPLNGRVVSFYTNSLGIDSLIENQVRKIEKTEEEKAKLKHGHYEEVIEEEVKVIEVPGKRPSGLKGAIVIPKEEAIRSRIERGGPI